MLGFDRFRRNKNNEDALDLFYRQYQFIFRRLCEKNVEVKISGNRTQIYIRYNDFYFYYSPVGSEYKIFFPKNKKYFNEGPSLTGTLKDRNFTPNLRTNSRHPFVDIVEEFAFVAGLVAESNKYYLDVQNTADDLKKIKPIILDINYEIIQYLNKNPNYIYSISSRKFEELIAHIFKHFGFNVELTQMTRDGGRDIIAYIKNAVCSFLTFVECKHYKIDNPIGVSIVREVYGVQKIHRANKSVIVTSSYFTKDAYKLVESINTEIELKDHSDLRNWLQKI